MERLVRYDGDNRYGQRDTGTGGDDWVKPSVRTVARHFGGIDWGDFSNMNGGHFPPQRRNTNAFWRAIRNVELDDGRMARDVIRPAGGHDTHFHWRVSND